MRTYLSLGTGEVAGLLGCTRRDINLMHEYGILAVEGYARGSGVNRVYSRRALYACALALQLQRMGLAPRHIRAMDFTSDELDQDETRRHSAQGWGTLTIHMAKLREEVDDALAEYLTKEQGVAA